MTLAKQLKSHRQRLGYTQAEAAALLEVSKRCLEEWEAGKRVPLKVAQEGALARLTEAESLTGPIVIEELEFGRARMLRKSKASGRLLPVAAICHLSRVADWIEERGGDVAAAKIDGATFRYA